ncbi:DNA/RNA nuclease SfsA [uncultured Flavonifractor sp.]|uniref:DNA/RNA nuclease SfsA n=1 Tax=uncultured Flavonifractor sp. TaxID=1193534 RepID=UPI00262CD2C9|nr:DNA/RNA nuclease SfsA [uncultured Flavonifractor sp.]
MQYRNVKKGIFRARPNRFIAHVEVDGAVEVVHVKNTGRCRELLVPGATVYLEESDNPARKTRYDLIAVEKGQLLVNMDAQAPNKVFQEWAEGGGFLPGLTLLRPETTWGSSRFDFYWEAGERRGFVEVKGVTLEEDGHARFPDAPTERGVKHLEELIRCQDEGYEAAVCFVIQMAGMQDFAPNDKTHPAFGAALRRAAASGVTVLAQECEVAPDRLRLAGPVSVRL